LKKRYISHSLVISAGKHKCSLLRDSGRVPRRFSGISCVTSWVFTIVYSRDINTAGSSQ
jgi:hypothetical protein